MYIYFIYIYTFTYIYAYIYIYTYIYIVRCLSHISRSVSISHITYLYVYLYRYIYIYTQLCGDLICPCVYLCTCLNFKTIWIDIGFITIYIYSVDLWMWDRHRCSLRYALKSHLGRWMHGWIGSIGWIG